MSERNAKKRIYLDYAAATPLSLRAARAMVNALSVFGNPSSLHASGREAGALLRTARERIAKSVGARRAEEIVLTGSGSEGNALALFGAMHAHGKGGRGHLIVSAIEHKSVLLAAEALAREGYDVTYLPVGSTGLVSPEHLSRALRAETIIVSVMYANNEIGTVEPLGELARVIHDARGRGATPLFHTDACQAPGLLSVAVDELGVDLMTLNGSKVYGPKGVGALYVRDGTVLAPLILGEQFEGRRGGTESVALALGFAVALEEASELREKEAPRLRGLRELFFAEIARLIPSAIENGDREHRLPNNVHVTVPRIEGESILLLLDEAAIACSTGSACNARDLEPSHVLRAIGQSPEIAHGSVRFSMGRDTTENDVRTAAKELARVAALLRDLSSLTVPAASLSRHE